MTDERAAGGHGGGHSHGPGVRSEEDRVSTGAILFVGAASIVLFFLASLVTVRYLAASEAAHEPAPSPSEAGTSKIAMVEQQLFDVAVRGQRDVEARKERLRSYGWVDRKAGLVHIPIERAMELVAQGVRPAPNAPGETVQGAQP